MAGSYEHLSKSEAGYAGVETDLIENMGDAIEAMAHMYWMIQVLSDGDAVLIYSASDQATEIVAGRTTFVPSQDTHT